jgi:hypothetical protein
LKKKINTSLDRIWQSLFKSKPTKQFSLSARDSIYYRIIFASSPGENPSSNQLVYARYFGHEDFASAIWAIYWDNSEEKKYFDYFIFNIVDCGVNCGLSRSGARCRTLAQTIGNARGLDINSPLSAKTHLQDLQFRRHQQRDDPNSAQGLDSNFASDRDCDSMTTTRLRHHRLRRVDLAAPDKS